MASKFRPFHKDLCVILDRNYETFLRLAFSLFGAGVIDEQSKTAIIRQKGLEGADHLLTRVHGYLEGENRPDRLDTILRLFESEEVLRDVTSKIKTKESSGGSEGESLAGTDEVLSRPVLHTNQTETQYLNTHPSADQDYLHPLVHSQIVENDVPTELEMCGNLGEECSPASEQVFSRPHPPPSCQQHQPLQLSSAAVAIKKDFASPTVESDVFIEELSQDQRWYTLGILLGVPTHKLDTISINNGSLGIRECLGELYKCCMELEGGVSWEQIVEALWKMKNVLLAASIHSKYTISLSPLSESEYSVKNRAKQVEVPDEVVQGFNNLSLQFSKMKHNVRQSIRQSNISVDDLQNVISDECSFKPLSGKKATVDNFLNRLSQYYSLLDVRVLEFLFKTLFNKDHPVQRQLTEYIELLDKFKSSAEMKHLVHLLKQQQTVKSGYKLVELKVREIWSGFTVEKFEKVLRAILKTKYSYTSQMTVEEGCICIRWVIPNMDTSKLIQPQPLEFLKIIGVVYLHIGDKVVYSLPEDGCDTLEAAMLQAVELKNTQALELLKAVGSDNSDIITKCVDNVVTVVSSVTDSSDTAAVTSSSSSTEREQVPVVSTRSQRIQEPLSTQRGYHTPDDVFTQEELFKNTDSELEEITDTLRPGDEHLEIQKRLLTEKLKQKDTKVMETTDRSQRPEGEYLGEQKNLHEHDLTEELRQEVSEVAQPSDVVSQPAFLPQMCGCGKCEIIGWRSGDSCQLARYSKYPKLLVINSENPSASLFKQSYDKHATLFHETNSIIELFRIVKNEIWKNLFECVENHKLSLAKIICTLRSGLEIQLPMFSDLDSLQNHCHSLCISWYNFKPLHLLVTRFLANLSPTLLADWNSYLTIFKEYCSARNLKDYSNVFFRVEENNIFLLEIDEHYYNLTLSDIEALCNSLSIALGCPSVNLHLVTVRGGPLIIYLYYSYSDYLTVFQSLTTEQLKMISLIKTYGILSLTDLHNQFRYDNIQSYTEALPSSSVKSLISSEASVSEMDDANNNDKEKMEAKLLEELQMLRKQSLNKDFELTRARNELTSAHKKILEKEEEANELKRKGTSAKRELELANQKLEVSESTQLSNQVTTHLRKQSFYKDVELTRARNELTSTRTELASAHKKILEKEEEANEFKRELDFSRIDVTRAKAELLKAHEYDKKMEEELQEFKAQILSIEGTSSKRELELANQKLEEVQMLKKQSFYKDVELTSARNELTSAHKKILEKEEEANKLKRELDFNRVDVTRAKADIKKMEEEANELKRKLDFSRVDATRAKAELLKAHEYNKKMEVELQELKAQILSIEGTSSKRELELAIQKLKCRESHVSESTQTSNQVTTHLDRALAKRPAEEHESGDISVLVLEITDHGELYIASKPVSVHWRDLGARLGVLQNTLATIEVDCNGKVEKCMSAMLEKWLRRRLGEVHDDVKPTWKSFCVALSHIDRPMAESLAEEHHCGDIISELAQLSKQDTTQSPGVNYPAFLPQMCGCGKCTVVGWRTGQSCENPCFSKFPNLLLLNPRSSLASYCEQDFARHAILCKATRGIICHFQLLVNGIWEQLYHCIDARKTSISKITRVLRTGLSIQLPMFQDLDSLQNHCHSLRVAWYNFRPLHLLVMEILAKLSPTLLADWNIYITMFKEYCSARNLKDFKDVLFRVEEDNIFLLEIDDHFNEFTLLDIEAFCDSLSIALGCPSVHLHLVTVRGGDYSYST